jgi:nitrite reductase/ring-hydroxylating ferredoxin subunit
MCMGEFVTIAKVADVPEGAAQAYQVGSRTIALFHQPGGQFIAIDDYCPHMGASLAEGTVEGGVVTCSWHGWQFRLCDGAWVNSPKLKVACYEVRIQGDEVQVRVPDR